MAGSEVSQKVDADAQANTSEFMERLVNSPG